MQSQEYSKDSPQYSYYEFSRQPLPYLQRKKIQPESYVSERLNKIRKQRAKIPLQIPDEIKRANSGEQVLEIKKNLLASPNKVFSTQSIISSYEPFRKELQLMRKKPIIQVNYQQLLSNLHPFSNAIRELGIYKHENERKKLQKDSIRKKKGSQQVRSQYQSLQNKKKSLREEIFDHSSSENQLKIEDSYFLNIGRMNLLENNGHKVIYTSKKSDICSSSFGQKKGRNILISCEQDEEFDGEQYVRIKNGRIKLPRIISSQINVKREQILVEDKMECENDLEMASSKTIDTSQLMLKQQEKMQKDEQSPKKQNRLKKYGSFNKKMSIPFQKYYYRSMLWKVNYSNNLLVEVPENYQHRLKAYIGKGNNSALIRGLVKRRIWFAVTDKIEEANFVWTQLKSLPYFKLQQPYSYPAEQETVIIQEKIQKIYKKLSLFPISQLKDFQKYISVYKSSEQRCDERLLPRNKYFKYQKIIKSGDIKMNRLQNHLINNYVIGNKKALFQTMSSFYKSVNKDVFDYLPLTFHVKNGLQDPIYFKFLKYFYAKAKSLKNDSSNDGKKKVSKNIWIVKPGENSNRGNGIKVCFNLEEIKAIIKKRELYPDGSYRTYILQEYIQNPLLYQKRKFDIRHYMMMSCVNGVIKGYWYEDGYVRTTSSEYNLKHNTGAIHLTNDAIQKNLPDYGKYQKGNKLSYDELDEYIKKKTPHKNISFKEQILPKMKSITADIIKASSSIITPARLQNNFQLFGMDFMLDSDLKLYLIEVNSNPCLEISCPMLGGIIPRMIQNLLQITMDALFPPPAKNFMKGVHYQKKLQEWNKFQLIFDEKIEGKVLFQGSQGVIDGKLLEEEDDTFEDDGEEWDDTD